MDNTIRLIHPSTFEEGKNYLYRVWQEDTCEPAIVPVMFIRYDPCPAFIIVRDVIGKKRRCLREDLFVQVVQV
jgi:hypothetical protein